MTLPVGTILGIDINDYHTHPQCNFNMARELVEDGLAVVGPNGDLTLTRPWTGSVSASAVMVKGDAQNGWTFWTVEEPGNPFDGQLIDAVRNQEATNPEPTEQPQTPLIPMAHQALQAAFQEAQRSVILAGEQAWNRNQWPEGSGVYLIWRAPAAGARQLLYIGKAGKYRRLEPEQVELNGGNLAARLGRWTPYCFQQEGPFAGHFEYGPNFGVNQLLQMPYVERYQHHVPAAEIEVECFCLAGWEQNLSPALLEAHLLQEYLIEHGDLPVANNEL